MADGVVQEFLNRSVYPETIPRQRDHSRSFVMLILTVVILLVGMSFMVLIHKYTLDLVLN